MIARSITAEEFAEQRYDLPDGGQWAELIAGQPVELHPPESDHGNAVLNLTKALADWTEQSRTGYACFEQGLVISRNPDTVFCPPISYFVNGNRWEEMDKAVTETCPALVVEVPSTPDRQKLQTERVAQYLAWGVGVVLVADVKRQSISVCTHGADRILLGLDDSLCSSDTWTTTSDSKPILPEFELPVADIFRQPDWWTGQSR